jgi:hypothetical protein
MRDNDDEKVLTEGAFLDLCKSLGYRALGYRGGYLVASVDPEHAELFGGCVRRTFQPERVSNPERTRVDVQWRPTPQRQPR